MFYQLVIVPLALLTLLAVLWATWRMGRYLPPRQRRAHALLVGGGGLAIALLVLGPPAWRALTTQPGQVAASLGWLAAAGAVVLLYLRLLAALRRRASGRRSD